ncbi:MAG: hypothetical protein NTY02_08220 [Acidobacteria bacterium]|nr:hypothetical protein [Acidobacteriota bacterium]
MNPRFLLPCSLAFVLALAVAMPADAGDLVLTIQNGRVELSARDVPLRQILLEWERVGGTRIVNRDQVPGTLMTLSLTNVPEAQALETLLRPLAGYMASTRSESGAGASMFDCIVIMRGAASTVRATPSAQQQVMPTPAAPGAMPGRPPIQRRVMPDGQVISFMDSANRPGEVSVIDDDSDPSSDALLPPAMRPPFGALQRPGQGRPGSDVSQPDGTSGTQTPSPVLTPMPTVPGATVATPGSIILPSRQAPPSVPPKPPGH